jgi:transcriptional regulator with PAS, ATPase and Fis domain
MQALYALLDRICQTEATVLIQGETGTGKELVAETIHAHSARAGGPLVRVNCAALPESLLESELFGHEKGAFTDAVSAKPGLFEVAHTGTIFLDEIGAMRWSTQAKLLRVLESQEFQRLGGTQTLRMEVRVLAATNRDLATALAQGEFREDLFYRLNVIPLFLPPLRERKEDLFLLVEHFLERLRRDGERNITHVTPEAMEVLRQYDFPGNVRDLENALQYAFVVCRGDAIQPADLPLRFHRTGGFPGPVSGAAGREALTTAPPRGETPEAMLRLVGDERERVRTALEATRWSMKEGAALLHIDRSTLWRKMKKYDLARPQQVS